MNFVRYLIQLGLLSAVLGGSVVGYRALKAAKERPEAVETVDEGKIVLAHRVGRRNFSVPIVGYGTAQPEHVYSVRPQVSGRIVRLSENFVEGRSVAQGEFLFEIDKQDIAIAILEREATIQEAAATMMEIRAQVDPIDSEIRRLRQKIGDLQNNVRVKQQAIDLAAKEVARLRPLVEAGSIAKSQLETAQIALNQHEQAILEPKSELAQTPILIEQRDGEKKAVLARIDTVEAQRKVALAGLEKAKLDMTRTVLTSSVKAIVVRSPDLGGVPAKILALGAFVAAGEDVGRQLMEAAGAMDLPVAHDHAAARGIRGAGEDAVADTITSILAKIGEVRVEYFRDPTYSWTGVLDRIKGNIDETTRTLTAIVRVAGSGNDVIPGKTIPLAPGMFCRVLVPGYEHREAIVIPRSALRADNKVFRIEDGRLAIREVSPLQILETEVVLRSGLDPGDILVLSDLPAAVPGQKLRPSF